MELYNVMQLYGTLRFSLQQDFNRAYNYTTKVSLRLCIVCSLMVYMFMLAYLKSSDFKKWKKIVYVICYMLCVFFGYYDMGKYGRPRAMYIIGYVL